MALNSSFAVTCCSTDGVGANKYNLTYNFDWGAMPEGQYEMHFALASTGAAFTSNDIVIVQIQGLGVKMENYSANGVSGITQAQVNNFIGVVVPSYATANNEFLFSHYEQNPPIFLASKPRGNTFTVSLLSNTGIGYYNAFQVDYVLSLYFKKVGH